tara:strand:+ start:337 stop:588 length:252 start_codon:yes stop_codon:yes gene_type:complete
LARLAHHLEMDGLLAAVVLVDLMCLPDLADQAVEDQELLLVMMELLILVVEEVVDSTLVLQLVVMVDLVSLSLDIPLLDIINN